MITTWSTVWATSASRWLDTRTARPSAARRRSRSRSQRTPAGSRPLVGSSRTRTADRRAGRWRAPSRWRMPSEKPPTRRPAASVSPTRSRTSSDPPGVDAGRHGRGPAGGAGAVRAGWTPAASSTAPTVAAGSLQVGVGDAVDGGRAGVGADQAEQHPQGGGLAGAVGAEEPGDRAGVDGEGQVVDGGHAAEALGEPVDLDGVPWPQHPTSSRRWQSSPSGLDRRLSARRAVRRPTPRG